jgi:hypothetical protein
MIISILCIGFVGFSQSTVELSVSTTTATEVAGTIVVVTVTASAISSNAETVSLNVTGSNISPSDYTLSNTSIIISAGMTTGNVTFVVNDDAVVESLESAILTLSNPSSGIVLGSTISQMVHIEDNDIFNTATLYNGSHIKNNSLITVQGKPISNSGTISGTGTFQGAFINNGVFSPGNN